MGFGSLSSQQRVFVLLELLGGPKFAGEMRAAAVSSGLLGKTVEKTGKQMEVASRRTFLASQAMYTIRRYAFFGTIALTAMGVAVAKLGFNYLSAMQNARVALSPVIKDQATLNGYLNQLFQISKYSPFVITDLAIAFRQLFAGLHPEGVSAPTILKTIQSLTDFMAFSGKTGPGQLQRTALALQHMAYAGHLTGYAINQLSRDGIPIMAILNKELGITGDQFHNIAKMGIPAATVLAAINKYAKETPGVKDAALRLSLRTFTGLMQVVRDSISQVSGSLLGGAYKGGQSWLLNLVKPGGPLDLLSKFAANPKHNSSDTFLFLSKQLTGGTGLGRGFLLVLSVLKNIGNVFLHVIIPAIMMAAKTLIVFYPALKLVNFILGELIKHAKIAKWVFAVLAAEFLIVHTYALGMWAAMTLLNLATFGAVGPLLKYIKFLRVLRITELVGGATSFAAYALATEQAGFAGAKFGDRVYKNNGILAVFGRSILGAIKKLKALRIAMIEAGFASAVGGGLVTGGAGLLAFAAYKDFTTKNLPQIGKTSVGTSVVQGPGGVKYVQTPGGGRLTRLAPGSQILPSDSATPVGGATVEGNDSSKPVHVHSQVILDRKVVAEANARAVEDRKARR